MNVAPVRTALFTEGGDLVEFIFQHVPQLADQSILVVTSKIVALAESRTAEASEKERIIKAESDFALKTKWVWLTIAQGNLLANAGIDSSNADGRIILLPRDSVSAAIALRAVLIKRYGLEHLGVIITDSRAYPMRLGTTGVALGFAGFEGIHDYRGRKDLFGRPFEFSRVNVADSLATAAVFEMGEGDERQPLCIITQAPVCFTSESPEDIRISAEDDLYGPLLSANIHRV